MYVYVQIYVYIYICVYVYIHIHIYIYGVRGPAIFYKEPHILYKEPYILLSARRTLLYKQPQSTSQKVSTTRCQHKKLYSLYIKPYVIYHKTYILYKDPNNTLCIPLGQKMLEMVPEPRRDCLQLWVIQSQSCSPLTSLAHWGCFVEFWTRLTSPILTMLWVSFFGFQENAFSYRKC